MSDIIEILAFLSLIAGVTSAYAGWQIYEDLLFAAGAVIGFVTGLVLGFALGGPVLGGLLGAVLAYIGGFGFVYAFLAVYLVIGYSYGMFIGYLVFTEWLFAVGFGVAGALLAVLTHQYMVILATAAAGSTLVAAGTYVATGSPDVALLAVAVIFVSGSYWQHRQYGVGTAGTDEPDESSEGAGDSPEPVHPSNETGRTRFSKERVTRILSILVVVVVWFHVSAIIGFLLFAPEGLALGDRFAVTVPAPFVVVLGFVTVVGWLLSFYVIVKIVDRLILSADRA